MHYTLDAISRYKIDGIQWWNWNCCDRKFVDVVDTQGIHTGINIVLLMMTILLDCILLEKQSPKHHFIIAIHAFGSTCNTSDHIRRNYAAQSICTFADFFLHCNYHWWTAWCCWLIGEWWSSFQKHYLVGFLPSQPS